MPDFTHVVVGPEDTALIQQMYELGRDNPIAEKYTCTLIPHPLLASYQSIAARPDQLLIAVFDGGELRSGIGVDKATGEHVLGIFKRYGDGATVMPEGIACVQYQTEVVRALVDSGASRTPTANRDADLLEFYDQTGIEVIEPT